MTFDFGNTPESEAFFDRHPKFFDTFERLMLLGNKFFGRVSPAKDHAEDVCFCLGHTCRDDYIEILFLAANGYGTGASKLLRGLYERAVTIAHIARHPEKVDQFIHFAAIQEYRAMEAALEIVDEKGFNEAFAPSASVASIRQLYDRFRAEFPGRAASWDVGLNKMAKALGDPYDKYYLSSYTIPNFHVHATLASALDGTPKEIRAERNIQNADFALFNATACLLFVMREQNNLFHLGLEAEIEGCERDVIDVFVPFKAEKRAH